MCTDCGIRFSRDSQVRSVSTRSPSLPYIGNSNDDGDVNRSPSYGEKSDEKGELRNVQVSHKWRCTDDNG